MSKEGQGGCACLLLPLGPAITGINSVIRKPTWAGTSVSSSHVLVWSVLLQDSTVQSVSVSFQDGGSRPARCTNCLWKEVLPCHLHFVVVAPLFMAFETSFAVDHSSSFQKPASSHLRSSQVGEVVLTTPVFRDPVTFSQAMYSCLTV